ncbi:low molecular weight protein-tyrosine-phosphatase [Agrobacterium sp. ES01]|uniref:low molecular weight protein-tyrosine-phosphatase n=1 Tax=Agrobacterium sp. ES01 TaxID=3420714 RepID=UPI003D0B88E8
MQAAPVLFVCLGNICRSPLAEGIFRHLSEEAGLTERYPADSAGTGSWHAGGSPDPRSIAIARQNGINIENQKARQVTSHDFERFALILAMDRNNLENLRRQASTNCRNKIHLFADFALGTQKDVPDPYYGGEDGFKQVYNMLFSGCSSLLAKLEAR